MEVIEKYKWTKNDDGTYNILDVPIFRLFQNDKQTFDRKWAETIISNYVEDTREGHYPRIFISHHNYVSPDKAVEERPGAGYVSNLKLKGDRLYCNYAYLTAAVFQSMMNDKKYPYRSLEIDLNQNRILGLALLDSRDPKHKNPILMLEENETVIFCNEDIMIFQKGIFMENKETGEELIEEKKEEAEAKETFQDDKTSSVETKLDTLIDMLSKLMKMEVKEQTSVPTTDTPIPSSVAYQNDKIESLQKQMEELIKKQETDVAVFQVTQVCANNGLDKNKHIGIYQAIQGEEQRKAYLDMLSKQKTINPYPEHFMTSSAKEGIKLFQASQDIEGKVLQKYQGSVNYNNAKKAIALYQNIMQSGDEERIKITTSIAPNMEKYVEQVVFTAERDPEYFNKITM